MLPPEKRYETQPSPFLKGEKVEGGRKKKPGKNNVTIFHDLYLEFSLNQKKNGALYQGLYGCPGFHHCGGGGRGGFLTPGRPPQVLYSGEESAVPLGGGKGKGGVQPGKSLISCLLRKSTGKTFLPNPEERGIRNNREKKGGIDLLEKRKDTPGKQSSQEFRGTGGKASPLYFCGPRRISWVGFFPSAAPGERPP